MLFDGQNLYHGVRNAWAPKPHTSGSPYGYPSYDVEKLALALVARVPERTLTQIRFYTNPRQGAEAAFWHRFWNNKLRYLAARGVYVYRGRVNPGGQEKGVDVSLAIDLIHLTHEQRYDVASLPLSLGQTRLMIEVCRVPPGSESTRYFTMLVWTRRIIGIKRDQTMKTADHGRSEEVRQTVRAQAGSPSRRGAVGIANA